MLPNICPCLATLLEGSTLPTLEELVTSSNGLDSFPFKKNISLVQPMQILTILIGIKFVQFSLLLCLSLCLLVHALEVP